MYLVPLPPSSICSPLKKIFFPPLLPPLCCLSFLILQENPLFCQESVPSLSLHKGRRGSQIKSLLTKNSKRVKVVVSYHSIITYLFFVTALSLPLKFAVHVKKYSNGNFLLNLNVFLFSIWLNMRYFSQTFVRLASK